MIINDTLDQEIRRKTQALHIQVLRLKEIENPDEDTKELCKLVGIDVLAHKTTWQVGKKMMHDESQGVS